jgi:hypothetical protein
MEDDKAAKSSDYFGTFLETVQSGRVSEPQTMGNALWSDPLPMRMVEILKENGPYETGSLQQKLGVDLLTFSKTLQSMTDARFVNLSGEAGHETVALTDEGEMLATVHQAQVQR